MENNYKVKKNLCFTTIDEKGEEIRRFFIIRAPKNDMEKIEKYCDATGRKVNHFLKFLISEQLKMKVDDLLPTEILKKFFENKNENYLGRFLWKLILNGLRRKYYCLSFEEFKRQEKNKKGDNHEI